MEPDGTADPGRRVRLFGQRQAARACKVRAVAQALCRRAAPARGPDEEAGHRRLRAGLGPRQHALLPQRPPHKVAHRVVRDGPRARLRRLRGRDAHNVRLGPPQHEELFRAVPGAPVQRGLGRQEPLSEVRRLLWAVSDGPRHADIPQEPPLPPLRADQVQLSGASSPASWSGLRRLRAFTMPDCHAFCADMRQALGEMLSRFDLSRSVVARTSGYRPARTRWPCASRASFYEENEETVKGAGQAPRQARARRDSGRTGSFTLC